MLILVSCPTNCKPFLYSSSANAKKWEVELATLKSNNLRLTAALQESTANVDEWKRQLHQYREEVARARHLAGKGELFNHLAISSGYARLHIT